jgi:hypothetical protein
MKVICIRLILVQPVNRAAMGSPMTMYVALAAFAFFDLIFWRSLV